MRENMRRVNLVDDLIHRTDSPFVPSVNSHPLPSKFKMPSLDSYDGTHDLCDHIATFKTTIHLQGIPDEIMCRAFPTTLKGPARVWFSKIPQTVSVLSMILHSLFCIGAAVIRPHLDRFHLDRIDQVRSFSDRSFNGLVTFSRLATWGLGPIPIAENLGHEETTRRSKCRSFPSFFIFILT